MGIIHKLSAIEAQKIAAGEVVERPYTIVKELIENSLDAGATQITLYIQDGGRTSIRCIDNGWGMTEEDAHMSIESHATSKLTTIEDLETLKTFGFRGEALSSICAVSTMTIETQMRDQEHGIALHVTHGTLTHTEIISRSPGTDIAISQIFDNVPVRKKFLKSRETEWRALITLVQASALAHPNVAFTVYHDHQHVLTTYATTSLKERVAQLFDRNFSEQFLECATVTEKNGITICGGITHYQYQRYDRNQQFFFVNRRWIKNYKLGNAFNKGFQNVMPPGRYAAGIICIELPPADVDINVHPRKEEVVFLHPRAVELAIEKMVQKRLEDETAQRVKKTDPWPQSTPLQQRSADYDVYETQYNVQYAPQKEITFEHAHEIQKAINPPITTQQQYKILGQLLKTYLVIETQEGLLLVDQHAAHESILYEQVSTQKHEIIRMPLLFPEIIPVRQEDQTLLFSVMSEINALGIHLEPMGPNAVAITETPVHIKNYPLKDLIHDILSWIHESSGITPELWNTKITKKLYAMMACKAAVKAGDELSTVQMNELLASLYATQHRLTCPHGRPTTWLISQHELEKNFKRKL